MGERFLVLFFKKEQHSLFEKREPKTFIHQSWVRCQTGGGTLAFGAREKSS
jgi:hypothetical protein